jgi:hypothetical protein
LAEGESLTHDRVNVRRSDSDAGRHRAQAIAEQEANRERVEFYRTVDEAEALVARVPDVIARLALRAGVVVVLLGGLLTEDQPQPQAHHDRGDEDEQLHAGSLVGGSSGSIVA